MSHPDDDITILTEARDTILGLRKQRAIARNFGMQMERERNEAQADRDHLITIARDRLEKIRQLEREIEALSASNLLPLS
jgi:hypothetical protein